MSDFERLLDEFLDAHWSYHPVDASFAGIPGFDAALPPVDAGAIARERSTLHALGERLDRTAIPADAAARLDAKMLRSQIGAMQAALHERLRYHNPAWYTGEAAFGLISLMLPSPIAREARDVVARLDALPDFLAAASTQLADVAVPADWVQRARLEIVAIRRLLARGLPQHEFGARVPLASRAIADAALERFDAALAHVPDADPACGAAHLTMLIRDVHGLADADGVPHNAETLERDAARAYDDAFAALEERAARLQPGRSWSQQLSALAELGPEPSDVLATYVAWHERALRDGAAFLSTPHDYALDFAYLPHWARAVAGDLYFLFYRSPAPYNAGSASTYWVQPPNDRAENGPGPHNTAAIKHIHAVHHGSIGHHTQNARARAATSRLGRIAGTDCASGIMFLGAGTMVEGWACYAEDLLAEVPEFYSDAERLALDYYTLRNIACCLADIRLHTGSWTLAEMRRFYRDDVGFAPARIWSETTRNSMFPASRLMYWTGSAQIAALRARSPLAAKPFHDALLAFGSVPVSWIAEELASCTPSARS